MANSYNGKKTKDQPVSMTTLPVLSSNAITVLEKRYLIKGNDGQPVETPAELFRRVAVNIASVESRFGGDPSLMALRFYAMISTLKFLPNSPTLMNAGRELQQLAACFVLPIEDSMNSIFTAIKDTALIHQSGGGTGFSFSNLRPAFDKVNSTGGVASGPISFMKVFNSATEAVKQGGTRRGANMGVLKVDHPDIMSFITCKEDNSSLNNFNISVGITEEFMKAVETNEDYCLVNPNTNKVTKKLSARKVFDRIVDMAWKNGEPGILFLDRINRSNPTPHVDSFEATNPCGEQPLLGYESCNLGSVNLSKFVRNGAIDYDELSEVVRTAVRFLDNVIEANRYPLQKIEEMTKGNRKIGLGVMGFADMLVQMNIRYDSEDAVAVAEEVMGFINTEGEHASTELGEERGSFPNFTGSVFDTPHAKPRRNATVTTIAPTGTLSILANCSSGIEPYFALSYVKNVMDNDELVEVNEYLQNEFKKRNIFSDELMLKIAQTGSIEEMEELPQDIRDIFLVSHDIKPETHVKIQAAFQKHTDNAVSKTINFSNHATKDDIKQAFLQACHQGCKGITIYRDKSRDEQVLNIKGSYKTAAEKTGEIAAPTRSTIVVRPRPVKIQGTTTKMKTACGDIYVTVNTDEDAKPFEIFCSMGKAGGCEGSQSEAVGRLASLALRSGIEPQAIVKQLIGIRCNKPYGIGPNRIESCSDVIAKVLMEISRHSKDDRIEDIIGEPLGKDSPCPDCGCKLEMAEGCEKCHFCGFSKCY